MMASVKTKNYSHLLNESESLRNIKRGFETILTLKKIVSETVSARSIVIKMAAWPEIHHVKNENRYELVLSGSSVSQRLEKHGLDNELFSCVSINFLKISETCLSAVPPDIKMLHNLTSLVLHSNKLTELCPEICDLEKLKMLDASNNEIREIPEGITKLEALATLNLRSNKIEKIPNMSNNKWLSTVDLSRNAITDMTELCHKELIHLAELHLKGNKINFIPVGINQLIALKFLDLSDNEITAVVGEVGDIPKLKDINLEGNPLADKRLAKMVVQCKSKQILDYIREHCVKESKDNAGQKGKKGKKSRVKQNSCNGENLDTALSCKYKIVVSKPSETICTIKRTEYVQEVRPHILCCIVKDVILDVDIVKKFIQLQTRVHDGICDKRNFATVATHDYESCKGQNFIYTALSPEGLKITPLSRNKEYTGKELFQQLQTEAENFRKEKKRSTYSGIHKFLHLLEGKPLFPCLLNSENTVISFPPLTNCEFTKISIKTKNILVEVTSSTSQGNCKKVLDYLLREMLLSGIGVSIDENGNSTMTVEQVKIEEPNGNLIAVYPSRIDLVYNDSIIDVVRD